MTALGKEYFDWIETSVRLPENEDMRCWVVYEGESLPAIWNFRKKRWDDFMRVFLFEAKEVTHWRMFSPPDPPLNTDSLSALIKWGEE